MAVEITEEQIRPLLELDEVRDAVENALRLYSKGSADQPVRVMVSVKEHGGFLGVTPSYAGALDGYMFGNEWDLGTHAREIKGRVAANFEGWETPGFNFDEQVARVIKALRAGGGAREPEPPSKL